MEYFVEKEVYIFFVENIRFLHELCTKNAVFVNTFLMRTGCKWAFFVANLWFFRVLPCLICIFVV